MDLDLYVVTPGDAKEAKVLYTTTDSLVSDALASLLKNYGDDIQPPGGEVSDDWGLFYPEHRTWLLATKDFESYDIANNTQLQLRRSKAALRLVMPDRSTKRIPIDWSKPVKFVVKEIGDRLGLGAFADTYGLRLSYGEVKVECGNTWLSSDETLERQNVTQATEVFLCKRFFDTFNSLTETTPGDEHLSYCQVHHELMEGYHDSSLEADQQIELAALLTLISSGRKDSRLPTSFFSEASSSILTPKYRKKPKSDFLDRISATFSTMCQQSWSSDMVLTKRKFLQVVSKIPTFGVVNFHADGVRLGDGAAFETCVIAVSSSAIVISKRQNLDRSNTGILDRATPVNTAVSDKTSIPLEAVLRSSVVQNVTTFSFMSTSGSIATAAVNTPHASVLSETINGLALATSLRKQRREDSLPSSESPVMLSVRGGTIGRKSMKPSASTNSISGSLDESQSFSFTESTLEAAIDSGLEKFVYLQNKLTRLSLLDEKLNNRRAQTSKRKALLAVLNGDGLTNAAQSLTAVSTGVTALARAVQSGMFFKGTDMQKSITSVSRWISAVNSVGRNVSKSDEQPPPHSQTIACMTKGLISMCTSFLYLISAANVALEDELKSTVVVAELAITTGCSALQLALQGQMSDSFCSATFLSCSRDIESCSSEMVMIARKFSDLLTDLHASPVKKQIDNASSLFTWHIQALTMLCPILFTSDKNLSAQFSGTVHAIKAIASSLLNRTSECLTETTESEQLTGCLASMKHSWAIINQTSHIMDTLSSLKVEQISPSAATFSPLMVQMTTTTDQIAYNLTASLEDVKPLLSDVHAVALALARTFENCGIDSGSDLFASITRLRDFASQLKQDIESPDVSNAQAFTHTLQILGCSLVTATLTVPSFSSNSDKIQWETKVLIMTVMQFRAVMRLCASPLCDLATTKADHIIVRRLLDELDVLINSILPTIVAAFTEEINPLSTDELVRKSNQWQVQMQAFQTLILIDCDNFGIFSGIIDQLGAMLSNNAPVARSNSRTATSINSDPGTSSNSSSIPLLKFSKVAGSRMSLALGSRSETLRSGSSVSSASGLTPRSKTIRRINVASIANKISVNTKDPFVLSDDEGDVEALNEGAMLQALDVMISSGQPPSYLPSMSYKEVLEIFLLTFPYITTTNVIMEKILTVIKNKAAEKSDAFHDVATRVRTTLPLLFRLHPQLAQDLRCRLTTSRITAMLADDINIASRAVDDALKESLDIAALFERIKSEQRAISLAASNMAKIDLATVDLDSLAEQLTFVEQFYFKAVAVSDLLQSNWVKKSNALTMWVSHSNSLSRWVASRILQCTKRAQRANLISRLIKLINLLWGLKNFSSAITIFLALSLQSISRLRKTWSHGTLNLSAQFQRLHDMIKPLKNFIGYRDELGKVDAPGIPYMAVLTKDLVTLEEILDRVDENALSSASATLEETGRLLNVHNMQTILRIISQQFRRFKQAQYQMTPDPSMFSELFHPDAFGLIDDADLVTKSLEVEPNAGGRPSISSPSDSRQSTSTGQPTTELSPRTPTSSRRHSSLGPESRTGSMRHRKNISESSSSGGGGGGLEPESQGDSPLLTERNSMQLEKVVPWRSHSSICAAAASAASEALSALGEMFASHQASCVLKSITASLQDEPEPRFDKGLKPSRVKSSERPEQSQFIPIAEFLEVQANMNDVMEELNCQWVLEEDISPEAQWRHFLSRLQAIHIHTITTEMNLAASRALCASHVRPVACSRSSTVQRKSDSVAYLTLTSTYSSNRVRKDPTTVETEILSMLSPLTSQRFSSMFGRVRAVGQGKKSVQVTFSIVVPVKPLK